ncbi:MAG: nucleotidyltransferase domain-containing protein [Thermofilaceae archaeon]
MVKPVKVRDSIEVLYSTGHWALLNSFRFHARSLMALLPYSLLVGSVARGDVHSGSDIDIALVEPIAPSLVEEKLLGAGLMIESREIVQATPRSTPKLYIHLKGNVKVSLPLAPLSPLEEEFFGFAGSVNYSELERRVRKPGVNKKLLIVLPTEHGHVEYSIVGREGEVAKLLDVSPTLVKERVATLLHRDERGRSGLFLRVQIPQWESTEEMIVCLAQRVPALKKRLKSWF